MMRPLLRWVAEDLVEQNPVEEPTHSDAENDTADSRMPKIFEIRHGDPVFTDDVQHACRSITLQACAAPIAPR